MSSKTFPTGFSDIGPTLTVTSTILADDGTTTGTVTPTEVLSLFGLKQTAGVAQVTTTPTAEDNSSAVASTAFVAKQTSGVFQVACGGGADVTVSAANAGNGILVLTGTLTANINVIVPTTSRTWIVSNNTVGSFTLNFKTTTGTGVTVPQGVNLDLFSNGTNIYVVGNAGGSTTTSAPTPIATATTVGTVKPGAGLAIGSDGTLSAIGSAIGSAPGSRNNRYWRFYINTNDENAAPVFSQLGMYAGRNTPNLATVPAQASASTEYSTSSNAGMALSTGWSANAPPVQWWQYDLGAGQSASVNQFSITAGSSLPRRAPLSYTIRSSADGVTFTDEWSGTFSAWSGGQTQSTTNPAYAGSIPIPPSVQASSYHPGKTIASEIVSIFVASQPLLVPAGLAGMVFYAATLPTAPVNFSASFLHLGTWTVLGVVTVSTTGTLTLPSNASQALQAGDVYKLVGPSTPDATLQDFCFNVPFLRT